MPKKIIFMGTPDFSVPTLKALIPIVSGPQTFIQAMLPIESGPKLL